MTTRGEIPDNRFIPKDEARNCEQERAVRNWYYGVRQPPLHVAVKIEAATNGSVTAADMIVAERAAERSSQEAA